VLLKLYIYGYLNRVLSSRRLEREAGRNVEVMWLRAVLLPITRRLLVVLPAASVCWPATSARPKVGSRAASAGI